jgi:NADH:ubiquinone oxidoreductase subunit C
MYESVRRDAYCRLLPAVVLTVERFKKTGTGISSEVGTVCIACKAVAITRAVINLMKAEQALFKLAINLYCLSVPKKGATTVCVYILVIKIRDELKLRLKTLVTITHVMVYSFGCV